MKRCCDSSGSWCASIRRSCSHGPSHVVCGSYVAALAARYTSSATRCWHADDVYIGADLRGVLDILIEVLGLRGTHRHRGVTL